MALALSGNATEELLAFKTYKKGQISSSIIDPDGLSTNRRMQVSHEMVTIQREDEAHSVHLKHQKQQSTNTLMAQIQERKQRPQNDDNGAAPLR